VKTKKVTAARVTAHHLLHHLGEPIKAASHVLRFGAHEDPSDGYDLKEPLDQPERVPGQLRLRAP